MFWRIICLITNKLDNCLILIIVGFILIWRNTWLLYINVNNVGFYSSFISVLPFSLFSASPNVRFFIAPSESLFFTAHNKKEGGIEKSFGRQKMLGTAKPSGVIFFGTKGEDRNSFVSIHRNKFAVQKQRISDGA